MSRTEADKSDMACGRMRYRCCDRRIDFEQRPKSRPDDMRRRGKNQALLSLTTKPQHSTVECSDRMIVNMRSGA
ncbi:hypothetical protein ACLOJK_030613 [Asimina triloba]